jgi:hypothetical protein
VNDPKSGAAGHGEPWSSALEAKRATSVSNLAGDKVTVTTTPVGSRSRHSEHARRALAARVLLRA